MNKKVVAEKDFVGMLCPHCRQAIAVSLKQANIVDVHPRIVAGEYEKAERPDGKELWLQTLDPHSRALVKMAEEGGLVQPFVNAFLAAHGVAPKRPEVAFLGWMKMACPNLVSEFVVTHYSHAYGGNISFVSHQSIMAVLSNDAIREFFPSKAAQGEKRKIGRVAVASTPSLEQLQAWTRTKNGYVAFRGAMFDEIKRKNAGDFARPMVESGSNY